MKHATTESYPKTSSKVFQISYSTIAQYAFLVMLGMLAITLHNKLRIPLRLPGHHGLEFIGLLVAGRMITGNRWAASISSLGAGTLALTSFVSFGDPFMPFIILLPGLWLDLLLNFSGKISKNILLFSLAGGLAYMFIPVARIVMSAITGYMYPSLLQGILFPVFTHFIFGLSGAIIAFGIITGIRKIIRK
jgi:hypothetical protein